MKVNSIRNSLIILFCCWSLTSQGREMSYDSLFFGVANVMQIQYSYPVVMALTDKENINITLSKNKKILTVEKTSNKPKDFLNVTLSKRGINIIRSYILLKDITKHNIPVYDFSVYDNKLIEKRDNYNPKKREKIILLKKANKHKNVVNYWVNQNNLKLDLETVIILSDFIWIMFKFKNKSSVNYEVGYLDVSWIKKHKKAKKSNAFQKRKVNIFCKISPNIIKARGEETYLFLIKKIGLKRRDRIEFSFSEYKGDRKVTLDVMGGIVNTAPVIRK